MIGGPSAVASLLWVAFMVAPVAYLVVAAVFVMQGRGVSPRWGRRCIRCWSCLAWASASSPWSSPSLRAAPAGKVLDRYQRALIVCSAFSNKKPAAAALLDDQLPPANGPVQKATTRWITQNMARVPIA